MIVPMKKVYLVLLDSEKKEALKRLRKLGLVHLEAVEGKGEVLAARKAEYDVLESASMMLADVKLPKAEAKKVKATEWKADSVNVAESVEFAKHILALGDEKQSLLNEIAVCTSELERLDKWGGVNCDDFAYLAEKGVHLALYEIPPAKYDNLPDTVQTMYVSKDKNAVRFLAVTDDGSRPADLPAEAFAVPMPERSTERMKADITAAQKRIAAIDAEVTESAKKLGMIKTALKISGKQVEFENVFSGMAHDEAADNENAALSGGALAWLTGFAPADEVEKVRALAAQENWAFAAADPTEDDAVPTKLRNNKFVSLIYPVTDFLGTVPGYTEYDISGWFLLFFALFFGMIFGDGGYGLLMVLVAVIGLIKGAASGKKNGPGMYLLFLLGAATVLWGMATCTWFGISADKLPAWLTSLSVPYVSNPAAAQLGKSEDWVSQNLQVFCFGIALVQLSIAHIKGFIRYRKSLRCFAEIGSFVMLAGLFMLVLNMVVDAERFPMPSWAIPAIGGGFVLKFIFASYNGSIGESVLDSCKNIVSVLLGVVNNFSDIVSYIRLWAVGLAGAAISETVNSMAGPMLGGFIIFLGVLLLVFGHGLNMVLNVLSVIVHGVRLNTLEFSGHLDMSWSGFSYKPFSETVQK